MKFTGFKVVPAICIDFSDEGKLYYSIAEDQDAELLNRAFEKAESGLGVLPGDLQLVWSELETGSVAVREVGDERDECPVSGDFFGSGSIIEAFYEKDGQTHSFDLISGDADDRIEQICAGLNALLAPVRIVADISGGALHGVESDRPAQILFVSNDSDDVQDFDAPCLVPPSENMEDPHAWWMREAELDGFIVDHYHNQVKPC
jgi:hypothetical protein